MMSAARRKACAVNTVSHIAVLVGSLRKSAYNRRIAQVLTELAPRSLRLELVEISQLSLYDRALEHSPPADWRLFRHQIRAADGVLILAPECHRSVPIVLRNALEIASQPSGDNAWNGKPGGVMCISPAGSGGAGRDHRLRQALMFLNVPVMQAPYMCRRDTDTLLDASGRPNLPNARAFLRDFIAAFDCWIHTTYRH